MTEEMYKLLRKILQDRAEFYNGISPERWIAYTSVLDMLEYAHDGNYECLAQFDYLGK